MSTLLLQQGYRIDYCAAADALTHAPETFSEFFNQRRRWGPSTLANIVDLLGDWKNTVRLNDNISTPYILYQFFLLVSTILGPATVLLMMAGAFTVVCKTTVLESYAISLVPAIALIIVCMYAKPSAQIIFATIASASYALVMTIVLVGTVGTAIEGGLTSPNVVFLSMLVVIYFIAALLHPEEFACVIPGALYFICIPTGYLVLTIYYLCNMHVVSWGTREVITHKSKAQRIEDEKGEEEKRKRKENRKGILGLLGITSIIQEIVELFRQARALTLANQGTQTKTDALLEELLVEIRDNRLPRNKNNTAPISSAESDIWEVKPSFQTNSQNTVDYVTCKGTGELKNHRENYDQDWMKHHIFGDGPMKRLDEKEDMFWKQLLQKYLYPIKEDKLHQEKVAHSLKNLRNTVVFGFFMTSALWIALTMQLQLLQDEYKDTVLFIKIPHLYSSGKEMTFEPLGMIFLALFSAILLFQFMGMLSHRWGTILHVLSITDISCSQKFTEKYKIQEIIAKAMELQRVSNIENEPEPDYDDPLPDYEDDDIDDDDDETISTFYSSVCTSATAACGNLPSDHHNGPSKRLSIRRRNSAVFSRRGLTTARTLRRAFERRYRNQLRRERSEDHSDSEINFNDNGKNDGFLNV